MNALKSKEDVLMNGELHLVLIFEDPKCNVGLVARVERLSNEAIYHALRGFSLAKYLPSSLGCSAESELQ